jgi:hypothetical protein
MSINILRCADTKTLSKAGFRVGLEKLRVWFDPVRSPLITD